MSVVRLLRAQAPGLLNGTDRPALKKLLTAAQADGLPVKWRQIGKGMLQLTTAWPIDKSVKVTRCG